MTSQPEMVIRRAGPADTEQVARIWHSGWADGHAGNVPDELYSHRTAESYPARVRDRLAHTWVAERRGDVLGFIVVIRDEVEQVYVDASARGSGVADALLTHAERMIARDGHARAWLAVVAGNARARAFYERSGWADAGPLSYHAEAAAGSVSVPVPCRRYEKAVDELPAT